MFAAANTFASAITALPSPVFAAGLDGNDRLTLHVARPPRGFKRAVAAAVGRAGLTARCTVRPLRPRRLGRARSLAAVLRPFAHDAIVYDPTGSIGRGNALVRCGGALRQALGTAAVGLYLEPRSRTLYIVCRVADAAAQRAIESQAAEALNAWRQSDPGAFDFAVRLCVAVPRLALVPLDDASPIGRRAHWHGRLHSGLVAGGVATLLGTMLPGLAQAEGPAVSAVNGSASLAGGDIGGHAAGVAEGSITVPLGYSLGAQFDALAGSNGRNLWGLSGQGFWRDPGIGLAGIGISRGDHSIAPTTHVKSGGAFVNRYGVEAEAYLGPLTPSVAAGYQAGNIKKHGGFAVLDLAWYPTDDLQLSGGGDLNSAHSRVLLGVEFQPGLSGLPGLTFFADAGLSGQRDSYALAGFRIYFGPAKTLIRRHREDDPSSPLTGDIGATYHNTSGNY